MGPEMMQQFRDQAERFGTRFVSEDATRVELSTDGAEPHRVWVGDEEHKARAVILAMGANHRKLGIPGEEELASRGVSYCATCDAAFFREKKIAVVGGGDSAFEEAIFLTKFGSTVELIHRRDEFRASQIMQQRAREIENIEFVTPYAPVEFHADAERQPDGVAREDRAEELRGRLDARADRRRHVHRDRPHPELRRSSRGRSRSTRTAT